MDELPVQRVKDLMPKAINEYLRQKNQLLQAVERL